MKKRDAWWRIIPAGIIGFGGVAAILALFPDFSSIYMVIGLFLAILGTIGGVFQRIKGYERAKYVTIHAMLLLFFLIGTRLLLLFTDNNWIWILLFFIIYIIAWMLPSIAPEISRVIRREQVAPETKIGILALNITWTLLPIISGGGAFIGMYINRADKMKDASVYIGLLCMVSTIAWAQSASHQLWEQWREGKRATGSTPEVS